MYLQSRIAQNGSFSHLGVPLQPSGLISNPYAFLGSGHNQVKNMTMKQHQDDLIFALTLDGVQQH